MSDDPDYTLRIYCDDESTRSGAHRGRRVKVGGIYYHVPDPEPEDHHQSPGFPANWGVEEAGRTLAHVAWERAGIRRKAERTPGETGGLARVDEIYREERAKLPAADDRFHYPVTILNADGSIWNYGDGVQPDRHEKWRFDCGLCGLDYQWRATKMVPTLEKLRKADIRDISLSALAATMDTLSR